MAEIFRGAGYRTAMVGKWHLGDQVGMRPWERGFDHFHGVLNSNDMSSFELIENGVVLDAHPDQSLLHEALFTHARAQIAQTNPAGAPLFLYLALVSPHVPVHVHPQYLGISTRGLYADALREMDAGVASILNQLKQCGLANNTLVVFTSDNGPWDHTHGPPVGHPEPWRWVGGCAAGLRGSKGTAYEGGVRVPLWMVYPGVIAPGTTLTAPSSMVDLLPTVLGLAQVPLPADRRYDGHNWQEDLLGASPRTSSEQLVYRMFHADSGLWGTRRIWAYRNERWKLFFDNQGNPTDLFDLTFDPAESSPVFDQARKAQLADRARQFHCQLDAAPSSSVPSLNLALSAQAYASGSQACSTAQLACDGQLSSGFESPADPSPWLMLDLGGLQSIGESQLSFGAAYPVQYRVECSLDGLQWQSIAVESSGSGGTVRHRANLWARYLRLQAQSTAGSQGMCILEWRVWAHANAPGSSSALGG